MEPPVPVAFYAPMKPPDHPHPSGDRTMARLLMAALGSAGAAPVLASGLRTYSAVPDDDLFARYGAAAAAEVDRLLGTAHAAPAASKPALWFTYHVHYKAPDLVGPPVARALGIPYVVAEGSRAPRRANGPWRHWHAAAEAALDAADLVLILNPDDREMLEAARPPAQALATLPPFLDVAAWDAAAGIAPSKAKHEGAARFLAVAMMRPGDKLSSFALLAQALARLGREDWSLTIVGDGPARAEVAALFAPFGPRVRMTGLVEDRAALAALYRGADALLWPAIGEAFGMVFLEAALQGCPAVAAASRGVPTVVAEGRTGLLAAPGDADAFAGSVRRLLGNPALAGRLSAAAPAFVREERSLGRTAADLRCLLAPLLARTASAA